MYELFYLYVYVCVDGDRCKSTVNHSTLFTYIAHIQRYMGGCIYVPEVTWNLYIHTYKYLSM